MLELIKDSIIFAFEDKVVKGNFVETSASGIYLGRDTHRAATQPRWARVVATGPECYDVNRGDRILIEPTMWTEGMVHDGVTLWRTIEKHVIAIDG
jgi:co-chaperonin GroES (HSP10)